MLIFCVPFRIALNRSWVVSGRHRIAPLTIETARGGAFVVLRAAGGANISFSTCCHTSAGEPGKSSMRTSVRKIGHHVLRFAALTLLFALLNYMGSAISLRVGGLTTVKPY